MDYVSLKSIAYVLGAIGFVVLWLLRIQLYVEKRIEHKINNAKIYWQLKFDSLITRIKKLEDNDSK